MAVRRFFRAATGLLLIGGLAGLAGCTTPGTISVTTTADTVADDGETSLREAFALANADDVANTIVLAPFATYDLTNCADGALDHTTARPLTLDAKRSTIHQTCDNAGILSSTVAASSLAVNDARLVGGPNTGVNVIGAGINARGSLRLTNTPVIEVNAGPGGTVVEGGNSPAADDVVLNGSAIQDSTGAAALRVRDGSITMESSTIWNNVGDGVRLLGTSTFRVITGGSVVDNTGWGVNATGVGYSRVTGYGASISRNALGGINCVGCGSVGFDGSSIEENGANAAPGSGGGISFLVIQDDPVDAPEVRLGRMSLSRNRANRAGGGLFVGVSRSTAPTAPATEVALNGTTVTDNVTTGDGQHGGGVAVTTGNLSVTTAEVSGNTAGGANSDGGGIYFREAGTDGITTPFTFTPYQSEITGNHASGSGGGVYAHTAGAVEFYSDFTGNTAGGQGGGAYLAAPATVRHGRFSANQAAEGGGIFFGDPGTGVDTRVFAVTFDGNQATAKGGGVGVDDLHRLDMTNVTISGNSAPRGGGLTVGADAELVGLDFVTLADNTAPVGANAAGDGGQLDTFASLLVNPLGGGASCAIAAADVTSSGYSFLSDASCAAGPTDTVSSADPLLGPLAMEAGLPVRRPSPASPIGGTVPADVCTGPDQVGGGRPQGAACEPGSIEVAEAAAIVGTSGPDSLFGTANSDLMLGLEGNDVIRGLGGADQLEGGPGDDWLLGEQGDDVLVGGDGNDVLIAGEGNDTFDGGPGDDRCQAAGAPEPTPC